MRKTMMGRSRLGVAGAHLFALVAALMSVPGAETHARAFGERGSEYKWRLCPPARLIPELPSYSDSETESDNIEIRADAVRLVDEGINQFTGDVEVIKGEQAIRADVVTYDETLGVFNAEGRTHIWDTGMIWSGDSAAYDLDQRNSVLEEGQYWLLGGRGRGHARRISHDREEQVTLLEGVDYTTCPTAEEGWLLSASSIKLDHESDRGSARNAVLRVRDIPVLYLPYINFPISDKRKSGFLTPSVGTTNESGFDTRIPYYWNIAPNHDATVTPRVLSDRGVMLGGEYRYMQSTYAGQFDFEFLSDDERRSGEDRSQIAFKHGQRFDENRGYFNVLYNSVSDDQYFEDFGRSLSSTSQRFLDRRVDFAWYKPNYLLTGIVQSYQTIDDSLPAGSSPYRRLPQLRFYSWHWIQALKVQPLLNAETTYFDRDDTVSGGRIDIEPALVMPLVKPYYDVRPKLAVRHTEYFLDDPNGTFDDRPSRTVPIFSMDSNLFLERVSSLFGRPHLQTLGPRAYYLLVPYVGQEDIPIFDSGLFQPSYYNLFIPNRFAGADRIGDANQLTLAVSSRMIDMGSGREAYRISAGQTYYFRDRQVYIPGGFAVDDRFSEFIAEAAASVGPDWTARGVVQWDPNEPQANLSAVSLRYHPDLDTVVNFGYRFRRTVSDIEQADVSVRWPLTERVAMVGRWYYSMKDSRSLETLGGIEYESCCWGLRVVGRRFLRNSQGEFDNGVFMQVQFRGLGGLGQSADSFLTRGIPGYEDPFQ
jgi:LPS-assembly protein